MLGQRALWIEPAAKVELNECIQVVQDPLRALPLAASSAAAPNRVIEVTDLCWMIGGRPRRAWWASLGRGWTSGTVPADR